MTKWDVDFHFITGVMVGLEFPDMKELSEDILFTVVLDLLVLRIAVVKWKMDGDEAVK